MWGDNMEFLEKIVNRKAFTGLMLMSILSILVGSIVLLITYLILNAVITAIGTISNVALNTSMFANIGVINSALTLVGIMLIGAGALGLIYMFSGLGNGLSSKRQ
jgi:hypothetical protein